jgi:uroporphyrinogen-III decarboxylase
MANVTLEMIHGMLIGMGIRIGKPGGWARYIAASLGGCPDVVPFIAPQIHDHSMTLARVPAKLFYWDPETNFDTHLAFLRWYGFDTTSAFYDVYNIEVEALGAKMIYSDHAMPTVDINDPLIKEPADLDRIGSLDTSKGRVPMAIDWAVMSKNKIGLSLGGMFCSHWSLICQAIGYSKAIRALKRDKGFAKALFDWSNDQVLYPLMQAFAKAGLKTASGADAWSAFPQLSFDLVDEWIFPYAEKLKARCKKELKLNVMAAMGASDYCEEDPAKFDKEIMFKCLENSSKCMGGNSVFATMGRTQNWDTHWVLEYARLHGKKGKKQPILISMNGRFVRDSKPEEITAKVADWVDILGRDGGLAFNMGNIPADTPPLNIHTAVNSTHVLGKYPIATDLGKVNVPTPVFQPFEEWLKGQPEEETIRKAREWKSEPVMVPA